MANGKMIKFSNLRMRPQCIHAIHDPLTHANAHTQKNQKSNPKQIRIKRKIRNRPTEPKSMAVR